MSIFEDKEHGLHGVDGVEVSPTEMARLAQGESTSRWAPRPGAVSWPVVVRWCREHPGQARAFLGIYSGVVSKINRRYPDLVTRGRNHRRRYPDDPNNKGNICDLLIAARLPDGSDPFEDVPGLVLRELSARTR